MSIYFHDTAHELQNRIRHGSSAKEYHALIKELQELIKDCSPFYKSMKTCLERIGPDDTEFAIIIKESKYTM